MIGVKMTCQTCLYAQQVTPTSQLSLQAHLKNFRSAQQRGLNKKKIERIFPLFSFDGEKPGLSGGMMMAGLSNMNITFVNISTGLLSHSL